MERYKLIISSLSIVVTLLAPPRVWAFFNETLVPINEIVSATYNKHSDVQLLASVYYSNGCYLPQRTVGILNQDNNVIEVGHYVALYDGECIQAILPQYQKVFLGPLQEGNYLVVDAASKAEMGELIISTERATFIPH